ncbi:putative rRNA maturation factor [Granulicella aggregans]|uniref:Endoribonuclease YbeY n=1 Tax=Granulicella aggregans TaxID=474949 RepID=A0A7W7ZAJ1_9BACT|nr:rRNA maturation RNase YbeY [Granulicella aggregans]MBB5056187.1 putative rRNA maturation factor [Granulicella aggregans]
MISIDPQAQALVPDAAALSKPALSRFLNRARTAVGLEGEVDVLLTSDAELKRLNRAFRNKNKATDILSFPTPPEIADHHAGDLAISLETAACQATQFGHTLPDELRILILHGLLHLSGLDHETDSGQMAAREAELRSALKLPVSLIARVTTESVSTRRSEFSAKKSPRISKTRHSERSEESPRLLSARTSKKAPRKTAAKRASKKATGRKRATR